MLGFTLKQSTDSWPSRNQRKYSWLCCLIFILLVLSTRRTVTPKKVSDVRDFVLFSACKAWKIKRKTHFQILSEHAFLIGSHNSFTYTLDESSPVANDQDNSQFIQSIEKASNFGGSAIRRIVRKWSETQHDTCREQLHLGIRYFDIRVSKRPDTQEFVVVHGLYGAEVCQSLLEIIEFIADYPKEIILLDFNHFYGMSAADHQFLMDVLCTMFGNKLIRRNQFTDLSQLTLSEAWKTSGQILIFYQQNITAIRDELYTSAFIQSPWANSNTVDNVLKVIEETVSQRARSPKKKQFLVSQLVITPTLFDILCFPANTLETQCARKMNESALLWFGRVDATLKRNLNIVITDFTNSNLCNQVIRLNFST